MVERYRAGARELGIELVERPVRTQAEADALREVGRSEVDAVLPPTI